MRVDDTLQLRLGSGVLVGDGCRFHGSGEVVLGDGAVLGERCVVLCHGRVVVGAGCRLGDEAVLIDFDHRFDDPEVPVRHQGLEVAPVVLEDGVVLGAAAVVLRGVTVGAGATVGPRSVVTRDVAPGAAVLGVPAGQPPPHEPPRLRRPQR